MNPLLCPLAVALVVALPQSDPRQGQEATPLFVPSREPLDPATVVVRYFNPVTIEAQELVGCANELFGGELKLRAGAHPDEGEVVLPRFVVLRNTLVIRDTSPAVASIAKLLGELDAAEQVRQREQAQAERQAQVRAAEDEREQAQQSAFARGELADTMVEIRPRYVSLATLISALEPFQRQVTYTSGGTPGWVTNSVTQMPDAQMVVVCESRERADRLVKLVDQIDRPQPQALVSVTLIRASEGDGGERRGAGSLPKELTENLRQLVPYGAFEPLAVGILRCSLATGRQSELRMDLGKGVGGKGVGSFSFIPEAYSAETGEVTLSECHFSLDLPPEREGEEGASHSFMTNLTFKSGEYVVLGAVGARPIFVVLRAEPVKRTN
jgi:hypothetical protein